MKHLGKNTGGRRAYSFTLIELIIVIAIICILMTLLLPALQKGRDYARGIECMSRLRQDSLSMFSYAGDYNGLVGLYLYEATASDPMYRWLNFLLCSKNGALKDSTYIKKDFKVYCGSGPIPDLRYVTGYTYGTVSGLSSNFTKHTFCPSGFSGTGILRLSSAGSTYPLLTDTILSYDNISWTQIFSAPKNATSYLSGGIDMRHLNCANVVFSDGHASRMTAGNLKTSFGVTNIFVPAGTSRIIRSP